MIFQYQEIFANVLKSLGALVFKMMFDTSQYFPHFLILTFTLTNLKAQLTQNLVSSLVETDQWL